MEENSLGFGGRNGKEEREKKRSLFLDGSGSLLFGHGLRSHDNNNNGVMEG